MWLFWAAAAVLAAAAAALVGLAGLRAASQAQGGEDASVVTHRRQLDELEELSQRGLLDPAEASAIRAEAARRLLLAADGPATAEAPVHKGVRLMIGLGVAATAVLALGLYLLLGAPGAPDQPYKARVAAWRQGEPGALDPAKMAAVLRSLAADRPTDPQVYDYLGRAQLAAGDPFAAQRAFERSLELGMKTPELYASLGQALMLGAEGKVTPEAQARFKQALELDPGNLLARYQLARARIADGETEAGVAALREIASELPEGDERRAAVLAEAESATGKPAGGGPSLAQVQAAAAGVQGDQAAFIRGMVSRLAARLKQEPNDPDGWARLVRSYGVLGDTAAQRSALAEARRVFANRPADLAKVEAEAKGEGVR